MTNIIFGFADLYQDQIVTGFNQLVEKSVIEQDEHDMLFLRGHLLKPNGDEHTIDGQIKKSLELNIAGADRCFVKTIAWDVDGGVSNIGKLSAGLYSSGLPYYLPPDRGSANINTLTQLPDPSWYDLYAGHAVPPFIGQTDGEIDPMHQTVSIQGEMFSRDKMHVLDSDECARILDIVPMIFKSFDIESARGGIEEAIGLEYETIRSRWNGSPDFWDTLES